MQLTEVQSVTSPSYFYLPFDSKFKIGDKLMINTKYGLEMSIVTIQNKDITKIDDDYLATFVRYVTRDDERINCENCKYAKTLLPQVKIEADKLNLKMKIGFVAVAFDKSKISVNYTADERVDFRELVKVLGSKFKSRIEMRQIGNRDETKQIGAMGTCGRECCCKLYLSDFDKVSIKMAKNQNIALNPNRINGMCGRLLCCLKYEDDFYENIQSRMPRIGWKVSTPDGEGVVSGIDLLRESVNVTFSKDDTTEIVKYHIDDIKYTKVAKKDGKNR